jgi:hypothetical protein
MDAFFFLGGMKFKYWVHNIYIKSICLLILSLISQHAEWNIIISVYGVYIDIHMTNLILVHTV